jgi:hypothetical protein
MVSKITGLARSAINRGEDDLDAEPLPKGQVRRVGGGRRALREDDPGRSPWPIATGNEAGPARSRDG